MSGKTGIGEAEIHAYVDGVLDGDWARAVAAALAADPRLADRVAGYRADMAMLKQVYGPLADRPVPREWLALTKNAKTAPAWSWRMAGAVAAVLLFALALGSLVYPILLPEPEIVSVALAARQDAESIIPVTDSGANRYDGMLSAAVSLPVKVPHLEKMGYHLTGIRLHSGNPGRRAAELIYRDRDNRLFTLYLRHSNGSVRFDQFEHAGLRVCIWQDNQLAMVMTGNVTTPAMQRLASMAYTGLTL